MNNISKSFFVACLIILIASMNLSSGQDMSPADIMERYGKAVVLIAGIKNGQEVALGSGFIVNSQGTIITNHHVIEAAHPAIVKMKNGDIYEDISIINFSERQDIAILKISGFDLPSVKLGNSNNVRVGERVIVIGNPHGYENTISDGLLSQIRDSGKGYFLHQISAPISAGSSGSPVFNQKAEVIGIATLSDKLGQNLNFSVPINYARGMIDGPIKYSLKEFFELTKGPTYLSEIWRDETVGISKALDKLNSYIIALYAAYDGIMIGYDITVEPHIRRFYASKYHISPLIITANQSLKTLQREIDALVCSDSTIQLLKESLLSATVLSIESSNKLIESLESPFPNWTKAVSAIDSITIAIERKLHKEFVVTFIDKIKNENPQLESYIIPIFFYLYGNKDKSPEEIAAEETRIGRIHINFQSSTRIPIIWRVNKGGPGDRANLKRGDIILGIVNGPEFRTQMDFRSFQKTTKPGEMYIYRISRDRQERAIAITLF